MCLIYGKKKLKIFLLFLSLFLIPIAFSDSLGTGTTICYTDGICYEIVEDDVYFDNLTDTGTEVSFEGLENTTVVDVTNNVLLFYNETDITLPDPASNISLHFYSSNTSELLYNCSSGNIVMTLNLFQETNLTAEANVTVEVTYWSEDLAEANFSFDITEDDTSYDICMEGNSTSLIFDMDLTYYKNDFQYRNWFLDNVILSNTTEVVDMYLVTESESSGITIHVQDQNGNDVNDALIQVQRYYMDSGEYKTVTIGKTDDNGDAYIYLIPYDIWYKFIITEDGSVTATIPAMQVKSTSLTFTTEETSLMELFEYWENIAYSCSEDAVNERFSCDITDTSGLLTTAYLRMEKVLPVTNDVVCEESGSSTSLTLTCNNINSTAYNYYYELYVDMGSDRYLLDAGYLDNRTLSTPYGTDGLVASTLLIGTVSAIGLWNPAVAIMVTLASLGLALYMDLVVIKFATFISLVMVGLIIMIKQRS